MNQLNKLIKKLCPNGVEYKTIQELCEITRGKVISKDFIRYNIGEYPVYSSQTENNGELGKINTYDFNGEYLTWTTDGANAGSVFYRNGKFSITNVCGLLKTLNNKITTKFLFYILSIEAPKYVNKGMGNPKLMSNVMAKIRVPVPPLEVQDEIVRILDDFILLSAELSAELKARQVQYEYYRNKLLENKNKTQVVFLEDILKIKNGKDYKHLGNGDIPVYGTGGIMTYVNQYSYNKPSVLIPRKGSLDKLYYVDKPFWNVDTIFYTEIDESKAIPKYIYYYLQNEHLEKLNKAGGVPSLTQTILNKIKIVLPNIEIQNKIINVLDNFDTICSDLKIGLPAEIEARQKQYEFYRDTLLTYVATGEIILQDKTRQDKTSNN